MFSYFHKFDIFGTTIGFKYNNEFEKKSLFGFILSFIFTSLVIFFFSFFGKRYFNNKDISTENLVYRYQNSQSLILNNTFSYSFQNNINEEDLNPISNKYYYSKHYYRRYTNGILASEILLEQENCSNYNWELTEMIINKSTINKGLCLNTNNLELDGNDQSDDYSYIISKFYLNYTDDEEKNSEIDEYINNKGIKISFHLIDTIYWFNSTYKGATKFLKYKTSSLKEYLTTEINLYISVTDIEILEDNLFYESFNHYYYFSLTDSSVNNFSIDPKDPYALSVKINPSDTSRIVYFKKKKLTEYVSEITGMMNLMLVIFFFITTKYNRWRFQHKLILEQLLIIDNNHKDDLYAFKNVSKSNGKRSNNRNSIQNINIDNFSRALNNSKICIDYDKIDQTPKSHCISDINNNDNINNNKNQQLLHPNAMKDISRFSINLNNSDIKLYKDFNMDISNKFINNSNDISSIGLINLNSNNNSKNNHNFKNSFISKNLETTANNTNSNIFNLNNNNSIINNNVKKLSKFNNTIFDSNKLMNNFAQTNHNKNACIINNNEENAQNAQNTKNDNDQSDKNKYEAHPIKEVVYSKSANNIITRIEQKLYQIIIKPSSKNYENEYKANNPVIYSNDSSIYDSNNNNKKHEIPEISDTKKHDDQNNNKFSKSINKSVKSKSKFDLISSSKIDITKYVDENKFNLLKKDYKKKYLLLPNNEKKLSFVKYLILNIFYLINIILCKRLFRLKCCSVNKAKINILFQIDNFINYSYSVNKYLGNFETTILLREILLDKEHKEDFKRMDYESKFMLY